MLTELCNELRNWFEQKIYYGSVSISDSGVTVGGAPLSDRLQTGQYFRIIGSVFNDGVHQFGTEQLEPENAFTGAIWAMAVPREVVELSEERDNLFELSREWIQSNKSILNSPYQSENTPVYSYTLKNGADIIGENSPYAERLKQIDKILAKYRKLRL